jgi:hypothetical protein
MAGSKKWGDATLKELSEWELEHWLLCFASPLPALKERTLGLVLGSSFPGPRCGRARGKSLPRIQGGRETQITLQGYGINPSPRSLRQEAKTETKPFKSNASSLFRFEAASLHSLFQRRFKSFIKSIQKLTLK